MFRNLVPSYDEKWTHQTELSSISDEEFDAGIVPVKSTKKDRIIQWIFFFLFFGWLRLILLVVTFIVTMILMIPVLVFYNKPHIVKYFTPFDIQVARIALRICYFCLGYYRIKVNGKPDENARVSVFNHQTVLDGPLLYIFRPFTVIGMAELKKAPFFGRILTSVDTLFVDRSQSGGTSDAIIKYLKDPSNRRPLAFAPEGKTTKGHYMLKFRTGAFLENVPIQPVIIRYTEWCPFGKTGVIWAVGGFKEWLWRTICLPMATIELTYLPSVQSEEFFKMSAQEKAMHFNLLMANELGVKATDRSNRDIFAKKNK